MNKIKKECKTQENDLILSEEENKEGTKNFEKILNNMIKKVRKKYSKIAQ